MLLAAARFPAEMPKRGTRRVHDHLDTRHGPPYLFLSQANKSKYGAPTAIISNQLSDTIFRLSAPPVDQRDDGTICIPLKSNNMQTHAAASADGHTGLLCAPAQCPGRCSSRRHPDIGALVCKDITVRQRRSVDVHGPRPVRSVALLACLLCRCVVDLSADILAIFRFGNKARARARSHPHARRVEATGLSERRSEERDANARGPAMRR